MSLEKILKVVTLIFAFLAPMALVPVFQSLVFPFVTGKHLLFRSFVLLSFSSYASLLLLYPNKYIAPYKDKIFLSLFGFVLMFFIADILAPDSSLAFWGYFERMEGFVNLFYHFIFFVILLGVMKTAKQWLWMIRFYLFASLIIFFQAFRELATTDVSRLSAPFGNPIYLAVFVLFYIGFATLLAFLVKDKTEQRLWLFTLPFAVYILWATGTRGAILAFVISILLAGFYYVFNRFRTKEKESGVKRKVLIANFLFLVPIIVLVTVVLFTSLFKSSNTLERFSDVSLNHGTVFSRIVVWSIAKDSLLEKPVFGWGHEGFVYAFSKHYNPAIWDHETWFDRAHNNFLDIAIQGGLFTFMFYMLLWFFALNYVLQSGLDFTGRSILLYILSAYAIFSLSAFDNLSSTIPFYIFIAFLVFVKDSQFNINSDEVLEHSFYNHPITRHRLIIAVTFSVTLLLAGGQQLYLHYSAAHNLAKTYVIVYNLRQLEQIIDKLSDQEKIKTIEFENKVAETLLNSLNKTFDDNISRNKESFSFLVDSRIELTILKSKYIDKRIKFEYINLVRKKEEYFRDAKELRYRELVALAMWYERISYSKIAQNLFRDMIKTAPKKVQLQEQLAKSLSEHGQEEEAKAVLQNLLKINPENRRAQKQLELLKLKQ